MADCCLEHSVCLNIKLFSLNRQRIISHIHIIELRGSFQKFSTLYDFSLKKKLFYIIHLHAFIVISVVLYQSCPTFGLSPPDFDLFPNLKKPLRGKRFRSIEEVSNEVTWVIRRINNEGVQTGIQDMPKRWTTVIKAHWRLQWRPVNLFCKINPFLKSKHAQCAELLKWPTYFNRTPWWSVDLNIRPL
jgi:hypothetical protein